MKMSVAVPVGEFLDKISILEIKSEKISDEAKLVEIRKELELLTTHAEEHIEGFRAWVDKLKVPNAKLWVVEDDIRAKERNRVFDEEFKDLARKVYYTNDERFAVKDEINAHYGSHLKEQKSYEDYA